MKFSLFFFGSSEVILKFRDLIEKLEKDVYAVLRLEKEEKEMVQSEAQVMFSVALSSCVLSCFLCDLNRFKSHLWFLD